nr:hypothetical protein [Acuticoccus mangrovi]
MSLQEEGLDLAEPLHRQPAPRRHEEARPQEIGGARRHLDAAGQRVAFHPRGGVHGVAPEVVGEARPTDDAGDHRAGVEPDAHPQGAAVEAAIGLGELAEGEGEAGEAFGPHLRRHAQPGHRHIGVADGFDLLHLVGDRQLVETLDQGVEPGDQRLGARRPGARGEANEVGEEDGHPVVPVGDELAGGALQGVGDRARQDREEQLVGALHLGGEELLGPVRLHQRIGEQPHVDDHDVDHHHRREMLHVVRRREGDRADLRGEVERGDHRRERRRDHQREERPVGDAEEQEGGGGEGEIDVGAAVEPGEPDHPQRADDDGGAEPERRRMLRDAVEERRREVSGAEHDVVDDERLQRRRVHGELLDHVLERGERADDRAGVHEALAPLHGGIGGADPDREEPVRHAVELGGPGRAGEGAAEAGDALRPGRGDTHPLARLRHWLVRHDSPPSSRPGRPARRVTCGRRAFLSLFRVEIADDYHNHSASCVRSTRRPVRRAEPPEHTGDRRKTHENDATAPHGA